jgi:hypothetical protein
MPPSVRSRRWGESGVARSLFVAQRTLEDAAAAMIREAHRIRAAQHDHGRTRSRLLDQTGRSSSFL